MTIIGSYHSVYLFFNPHQITCLLILEREEKVGEERKERDMVVREKHRWVASPPLHALYMDPAHDLRMCLTGTETATFWCMGCHSKQWSHQPGHSVCI